MAQQSAAELTKQGIAAYNAGDPAAAAALFAQATAADPGYEMAWLWRASTAATDAEKRAYLEQALAVNPASAPAKRGLAQLGATEVAPPPELVEPVKAAPAPQVPKPKKRAPWWAFGLVTLAFVGVCLGLLVFPVWWETGEISLRPVDPEQFSAYTVCKKFMNDRLRTPTTARFAGFHDDQRTHIQALAGGKYSVLSSVDSQNGFGAVVRLTYTCSVHPVGGGQWHLDDLQTGDK